MTEQLKGHGHVTPNADGFLARCGGPSICKVCKAELAALKAQEPVEYQLRALIRDVTNIPEAGYYMPQSWHDQVIALALSGKLDAPVSEAKAQGEYGDAYQGAREDLAIWKQRALKAEEKVRQQEQIIDHLTSEAQGESRFGEPVITAGEPCVPDGYVLADKKSLGMVLQALVNAPHHIRELQATRQPIELFSDNPINVLIANYETPAAPVQQVSVPDGWKHGLPPEGEICEARIPHHTADGRQMIWCEVEVIAHSIINGAIYSWVKETGRDGSFYAPMMLSFRKLAAAQAAPAADAGLVEALEHTRLFIVNGIDLGFIQMPEAGTPDPAHETLPMIDAALAAHRAKGVV